MHTVTVILRRGADRQYLKRLKFTWGVDYWRCNCNDLSSIGEMACDDVFGSSTLVTTSLEVRWHHTTLPRCDRVVSGDESMLDTFFQLCMSTRTWAASKIWDWRFNSFIQNFHVSPGSARCSHTIFPTPSLVTCHPVTSVDRSSQATGSWHLVDIADYQQSTLLPYSTLRILLSNLNNDRGHMQWSPWKESKSEMQRRWYDRRFEKINSSSSRNETGKNQVRKAWVSDKLTVSYTVNSTNVSAAFWNDYFSLMLPNDKSWTEFRSGTRYTKIT